MSNKANAIVIDIEDLDLSPTAVILSAGAIAFNIDDLNSLRHCINNAPATQHSLDNSIYLLIDPLKQLLDCRTVSYETQVWWSKQSAVGEFFKCSTLMRWTIVNALNELAYFIKQHRGAIIYFRGPDHDGAILENAFAMYGIKCPWKYNQKRDIRTFIDSKINNTLGYIPDHQPCFSMIKHNALHDAMNDAEQMCIAAMQGVKA